MSSTVNAHTTLGSATLSGETKERAVLEAPPGISASKSRSGKNSGTKDSCGAGCVIF